MECALRFKHIKFNNFIPKDKYFKWTSINNRHFCSRENDAATESSSLRDNSSGEKETKASLKKKILRFQKTPVTDETKAAAKLKLKSLLNDIKIAGEKSGKAINLAKPVKRISKKERLEEMKAQIVTPEKELDMAVKAVASTLKDDSGKVESELTEKLTSLNLKKKDLAAEAVESTEKVSQIDSGVSENLMSSVEEVATTISESPIPSRSELTKRLMRLSLDKKVQSEEKKSMKSMFEGLVIETAKSPAQDQTRLPVTQEKRETEKRLPPKTRSVAAKKIEHVNLFGGTPLNMFKPGSEIKEAPTNAVWQKLQERELRLLTQFAPANAFEEMIMWTEQGKHWTFPIDNETEMGDEENVGFHEHVFLEKHLKGFPTKGPIRHFMELVCVGLSKNPYITVERKIENIEWFRTYFKEKEDILKYAGAVE